MKKTKILKLVICCFVSMMFMFPFCQSISAASKSYHITYAPGLLGQFKDSLIKQYKSEYGAENVHVSSATGSIEITVAPEETMPNAPTASDISFKDTAMADQYYVLTSGWQPAGTKVSENATYVVQYGALVNSVEYSIRYVDAVTNVDVDTPTIARANANEVMSASAKMIDGYTFDTQTKTMTLSKDAEKNVITFYYTAVEQGTPTQTVENVVTRTQTTTTTPATPTTPAAGNNQPAAGGDAQVTVPENQTPLAGGDTDNNAGSQDKETVKENQTPLSKGDQLSQNNQNLYYALGGIVLVGLVIGAVAMTVKKKRA